jgi:hypothetical protein
MELLDLGLEGCLMIAFFLKCMDPFSGLLEGNELFDRFKSLI